MHRWQRLLPADLQAGEARVLLLAPEPQVAWPAAAPLPPLAWVPAAWGAWALVLLLSPQQPLAAQQQAEVLRPMAALSAAWVACQAPPAAW